MATPEQMTPSPRLRRAATAERHRLRTRLERIDSKAGELRRRLAALEEEASPIRHQLALLAHLAADEDEEHSAATPVLLIVDPNGAGNGEGVAPSRGYLRGAAIRINAVRVLVAAAAPSRSIHHSDWYELLVNAGYGVAGRDPRAAFLTQIGRSPLVRRTGERGFYALDLTVTDELRARLQAVHQELADLDDGQQTIERVATIAERRSDLTAEAVRLQQVLSEALTSLGLDTTEQ